MWQNLTPFDEAIHVNTDSLVLVQYKYGKHFTGSFYSQKKLTLQAVMQVLICPIYNIKKHRFEQTAV